MDDNITQFNNEARIRQAIDDSAFEHKTSLIHLFAGGSALHGATGEGGLSDLDIYGVFMEPREYVFGLGKYEHFVSSTSGDHCRNTPNDVDITLYSLRRWAGLAAKGNPTALGFLWANNLQMGENKVLWDHYIRKELCGAIISRRSVNAFRGFVTDQMLRLLGEKGLGKHGQRPELTANFGYDVKAAMHAVRLLGEGIELMETGKITYPRPEVEHLKNIRRGQYSLDSICSIVSGLMARLEDAENNSALPEKPNFKKIDHILVTAYSSHYMAQKYAGQREGM